MSLPINQKPVNFSRIVEHSPSFSVTPLSAVVLMAARAMLPYSDLIHAGVCVHGQYCFARAVHHELGFQMMSNGAGEVAEFLANKTANVASKWDHELDAEKALPAGENIKDEYTRMGFRELMGNCKGTPDG